MLQLSIQSYETKECFKDIKLIKSQRQPSSLKKLSTPAIYSNKKEYCSNKCTKTRCACCDYIKEGSFHTFKTAEDIFYLKEDMTCESSDLIYVIVCSTCNEEYIERLERRKQGFVTELVFIDNTSVNRNISNSNARNTFEFVEKDNSKYFLSSNYIRIVNT